MSMRFVFTFFIAASFPCAFGQTTDPLPTKKDSCEWAHFPGGQTAMNVFLKENLKIDTTWLYEATGKVYVQFYVDSTGRIVEPRLIRGIHPRIDAEVMRIFRIMPDWVPALCGDKKRKTKMMVPVNFRVH